MKLTANFDSEEFRCKDGTAVPDDLLPNTQLLANNLQVLRNELGLPIAIMSGFRTIAYNVKCGGAKDSQHCHGRAADITVKGRTPQQVHDLIELLIKMGKMQNGGLGIYSGWVHYDVGPAGRRWKG